MKTVSFIVQVGTTGREVFTFSHEITFDAVEIKNIEKESTKYPELAASAACRILDHAKILGRIVAPTPGSGAVSIPFHAIDYISVLESHA